MRERSAVLVQLARFLWEQRAFWLVPVVLGLVIIGALAVLAAATPLSPLIYPLF